MISDVCIYLHPQEKKKKKTPALNTNPPMTRSNLNCKMRKRVPYYVRPLKCIQHYYGPPFKSYGCWLLNRVGGRSLVRHFFFSCGCGVLEVSIYHSNYRVNDSDYSVNDSNHPNDSRTPNQWSEPFNKQTTQTKTKTKPNQTNASKPHHFISVHLYINLESERERDARTPRQSLFILDIYSTHKPNHKQASNWHEWYDIPPTKLNQKAKKSPSETNNPLFPTPP